MRTPRVIVLLLAFALAAAAETAVNPKQITIYRDQYGVPHVYGPTDASCVFGYLYAQAEDNFWQIEDSYIRALGRATEVYGERVLAEDLMVHALEVEQLSKAEYARAPASEKTLPPRQASTTTWLRTKSRRVSSRNSSLG
jgi:penicillin amidase